MVTRRRLLAAVLGTAAASALGGRARPLAATVGDERGAARAGPASGGAVSCVPFDHPHPVPPPDRPPAPRPEPACPVDAVRVDWIGGSDVVLRDASLPAAVSARVPSVGGRSLDLRPRTGTAAMPTDTRRRVQDALAEGADAVVVSVNLAWLHWDTVACDGIDPPHARYACLLTPISDAVDRQRRSEVQELVDVLVDAGVPAYLYTSPQSSTVLADPQVAGRIADAEARLAGFDPGVGHVELVARSFSRDLAGLGEGSGFYDMVHPTPAGVEVLADWLAADLSRFWAEVGLGRC